MVSREGLRPLAEICLESDLRNVLRLLAARSGQELVIADLANDAQVDRTTVARYTALLEALYLIKLIPGWATGATTRAKRRPKVIVTDTGLAAELCGVGRGAFEPTADGTIAGALLETLVAAELHKQASWSTRAVDIMHFRDRNGPEVAST